jgi:hypothetical protein
MRYEEWQDDVPEAIKCEGCWSFYGYRKVLFLYDICWRDCEKLLRHPLGKAVADQLIRSAGSISANIEEGYGRERFGFSALPWTLLAKPKTGTIVPRMYFHRPSGHRTQALVSSTSRWSRTSSLAQCPMLGDVAPSKRTWHTLPIC